jgi:hypothetical protein
MISSSPETNPVIDAAAYGAIVREMGMIAISERVLTTMEGTPHRVRVTIDGRPQPGGSDDEREAHVAVPGTPSPGSCVASSQDAPPAYSPLSPPTSPSPRRAVPQTSRVASPRLAAPVLQLAARLPALGARPFETPPWTSVARRLKEVEVLGRYVHPRQRW